MLEMENKKIMDFKVFIQLRLVFVCEGDRNFNFCFMKFERFNCKCAIARRISGFRFASDSQSKKLG